MKNSIIVVLLIVVGALFYNGQSNVTDKTFGDKPAAVSKEVVNKSVEEFLPKVVTAFNNAEEKYLKKEDIKPIDDGTNPDAAKCICKGTGQIRQGDGHVTACPYHAKKQEPVIDEKLLQEIEQAKAEAEQAKVEATEAKVKAEQSKAEFDAQINELKAKLEAKEAVVEEPKAAVVDPFPNPSIPVAPAVEVPKVEPPKLEANILQRKVNRPINAVDGKVHYQLVVFTASWCGPCHVLINNIAQPLRDAGFEVSSSTSADVRIVDIDEKRSFYDYVKGGITSVPLILEVIDNKIVSRSVGVKTLEEIINRYDLEE